MQILEQLIIKNDDYTADIDVALKTSSLDEAIDKKVYKMMQSKPQAITGIARVGSRISGRVTGG